MAKYSALKTFLEGIQPSETVKTLRFNEIEKIIGAKLPPSAYEHRAWWSNPTSRSDHPYAQAWLGAGWKVEEVDQLDHRVHFRRIGSSASQKMFSSASMPRSETIQHKDFRTAANTIIPQNNDLQFLLGLSFEESGKWYLFNDALQFSLTKHQNEENILYAFVAQDEIKYIGKSTRTLTGRMTNYKNSDPSQSTNQGNKARIEELLQSGIAVKIYVFVQKDQMFYKGIPINLSGGLEDNLIAHVRPPWNNRI